MSIFIDLKGVRATISTMSQFKGDLFHGIVSVNMLCAAVNRSRTKNEIK